MLRDRRGRGEPQPEPRHGSRADRCRRRGRGRRCQFQTYSAETLYSRKTPRFTYLEGITAKDTWDLIKEIELPREWQGELQAYAARRGIPFFSSPFDYRAVDELHALGVPAFKIASFEIVDLPLIQRSAKTGKPSSSRRASQVWATSLRRWTRPRRGRRARSALLQCTALYPTPPEQNNLRTMPHMAEAFGVLVGLSDHTRGIPVAVAAAALGVRRREALHAAPRAARAGSSLRHRARRAARHGAADPRRRRPRWATAARSGPRPRRGRRCTRRLGGASSRAAAPAAPRSRANGRDRAPGLRHPAEAARPGRRARREGRHRGGTPSSHGRCCEPDRARRHVSCARPWLVDCERVWVWPTIRRMRAPPPWTPGGDPWEVPTAGSTRPCGGPTGACTSSLPTGRTSGGAPRCRRRRGPGQVHLAPEARDRGIGARRRPRPVIAESFDGSGSRGSRYQARRSARPRRLRQGGLRPPEDERHRDAVKSTRDLP